jgi:hypothetical protein
MSLSSIFGPVLLVLGCALLFLGWRATTAPVEQLTEAVTGRYTSSTIWFVLSGLVASVSGAALILQGRWRS